MNFKFMTWYYDKETDPPRSYMFILPVRSNSGFYGWKYSCWNGLPTELNLAYTFPNIETDKNWINNCGNQFEKGDPKLTSLDKRRMLKDLFQTIGNYRGARWE